MKIVKTILCSAGMAALLGVSAIASEDLADVSSSLADAISGALTPANAESLSSGIRSVIAAHSGFSGGSSSVSALFSTDTGRALLQNPNFSALLQNPQVHAVLTNEHFRAIVQSGEVQALLQSQDFRNLVLTAEHKIAAWLNKPEVHTFLRNANGLIHNAAVLNLLTHAPVAEFLAKPDVQALLQHPENVAFVWERKPKEEEKPAAAAKEGGKP